MEKESRILTLEESVVRAMDGSDIDLFPYLPYILQDLWEIGTDPSVVIRFIQKNFDSFQNLKVLDLGSGKGAVSVRVAAELKCHCHGVDAIPEFVLFSKQKAIEFVVDHLCLFEVGDIRQSITSLPPYNVIVLGAIGPVLGNHFETLTKLSPCLAPNGLIIADDAYSSENSDYRNPNVLTRSAILQQIAAAGMMLIDEEIVESGSFAETDDFILSCIKKRCLELVEEYPRKATLFLSYIANQERETHALRNNLICSTMAIRKV